MMLKVNVDNQFDKNSLCIAELPIEKDVTFKQRLSKIKQQLNGVSQTPEVLINFYLLNILFNGKSWLTWIGNLLTWLLFWRKRNWISLSILNYSQSKSLQVCECNMTDIATIVQTPKEVGVGFCVSNYNGETALSITMDKR